MHLRRREDLIGWRQLSKRLSVPLSRILSEWRRKHEASAPRDIHGLFRAVDEAIEAVAPMVAVALAGIESEAPRIRAQRVLVDELVLIAGWEHSGLTILVGLASTLGFVYYHPHRS